MSASREENFDCADRKGSDQMASLIVRPIIVQRSSSGDS
jgi:hypothetical protein